MATQIPSIRVYESLRQRVENGFYSPGENLRETELASEYGVSRNTIKKALLMLETDALVTVEPNRGAKVRSYSKEEVLEYVELREELESFIVRLTAPVIDDESLDRLKLLLDEMEAHKAVSDLMAYSQCNQKFHTVIYDNCPNRTAVDTIVRLKNQMRKYNSKTILTPNRDEQSFKEHVAIYHALRSRNTELAESYMKEHMRNVRRAYEEYYTLLF